MKAAVWTDYGKMEIQEVSKPVIGDNEVLLKVRAAGLCMTDLHVYTGQFLYGKPPHILGHEICGEVAELGKGVTGIEVGQRVLVETSVSSSIAIEGLNEEGLYIVRIIAGNGKIYQGKVIVK